MKYRVDFGLAFLLCIFIMFFNELWTLLGSLPEAFKYGNIIYHIIAVIFTILTNLAIGIAAAIIFYYMSQFLDKKKNYDIYTELRKYIYFMFYKHLRTLTKIDQFSEINKRERIVPDFYDINDVPILFRLFKDISTEEQKENIKKDLLIFFDNQSDLQIETFAKSFKDNIEEIKSKANIRYFKGSVDLIETICIIYDDDFSLVSDIYVSEENKFNRKQYLEGMVEDYYEFLEATIDLYGELDKFIYSIDKKMLKVFIKMVD